MPGALEGGHALERNRVPDVDVRGCDVDAELHAERTAAGELPLELALRQHVDARCGSALEWSRGRPRPPPIIGF